MQNEENKTKPSAAEESKYFGVKEVKRNPFMLQIKISNIEDLIKGCFKKEPKLIGKNTKDSHMNTIGNDKVLFSVNKNAHVVSLDTQEVIAELNLKKREMSSSLVYK